jgi:hypothetical protein
VPTTPPSLALAARSRTPPELKWLLNERAALVGQAQYAAERAALLDRRVQRLDELLTAARADLDEVEEVAASVAARIEALDLTMHLVGSDVNPAAAACVRAWAGRYGERGALTAFVREHLRSIAPQAVQASELKPLVIDRFGLVLKTPVERMKLKDSIRTVLGKLRDGDGLLETVENWQGRRSQPLWRWKSATSLEDLYRLAPATAGAADEPTTNPNGSGGEVASQRAGSPGGRDGSN